MKWLIILELLFVAAGGVVIYQQTRPEPQEIPQVQEAPKTLPTPPPPPKRSDTPQLPQNLSTPLGDYSVPLDAGGTWTTPPVYYNEPYVPPTYEATPPPVYSPPPDNCH